MSTKIHSTAIIEEGAKIGEGTEIGPYAVIGAQVVLGENCRVGHHATVTGRTVAGPENTFFPYAAVGLATQDLKFSGGEPGLAIGRKNVFREFCTVHTATNDGEETRIGDGNHFLAYTHVAHDCIVGNGVIMSNNATLAGHVIVEDGVVMGGFAGVHQFTRIGRLAMIGGMSKITQDVPPFFIADGNPATIRAVNVVGLERRGYDRAAIEEIKRLFRVVYREKRNRTQAMECLRTLSDRPAEPVVQMLAFLEEAKRGIVPGS